MAIVFVCCVASAIISGIRAKKDDITHLITCKQIINIESM